MVQEAHWYEEYHTSSFVVRKAGKECSHVVLEDKALDNRTGLACQVRWRH